MSWHMVKCSGSATRRISGQASVIQGWLKRQQHQRLHDRCLKEGKQGRKAVKERDYGNRRSSGKNRKESKQGSKEAKRRQ